MKLNKNSRHVISYFNKYLLGVSTRNLVPTVRTKIRKPGQPNYVKKLNYSVRYANCLIIFTGANFYVGQGAVLPSPCLKRMQDDDKDGKYGAGQFPDLPRAQECSKECFQIADYFLFKPEQQYVLIGSCFFDFDSEKVCYSRIFKLRSVNFITVN